MKKLTIILLFLLFSINLITIKNSYLFIFTLIINILNILFFINIVKNNKIDNNKIFLILTNFILNQFLYVIYNYFKDYIISFIIAILLFINTYIIIIKFKKKNKKYLLLFPYLILNLILIFMSLSNILRSF